MRQPATLNLRQRGFLLAEAMLTAVVIAVGLIFISRGIAGSLQVLSRLQQTETFLRLADSALNRLETQAQRFHLSPRLEGLFDPPDESYQWTLTTEPMQLGLAGIHDDAFRAVTLTVHRLEAPQPAVRVKTIWPASWITSE